MNLLRTVFMMILAAPLLSCQAQTVRDDAVTPAPASSAAISGDFANHPEALAFLQRMQTQHGMAAPEVAAILSQARRQPRIIALMDRAAPRPEERPTGAWTRYRAKFVTPTNISRGAEFWRDNAAALNRAEQRYGVPAEYIVAILGVETRWGGYLGSHRVIDALATLAFDYPRRAEFFSGELENYLLMAREEGFNPMVPLGSYAGAMGLGQFMPSSFRHYAVDFDGDGKRDLWNVTDAIGSVANYFATFGWQAGQPVIIRASAAQPLTMAVDTGFNSDYTPAQLRALGLSWTHPDPLPQRMRLIRLDVGTGYEYWLGFENFYVITRYNHSSHYAMAVHQLAQAIRASR